MHGLTKRYCRKRSTVGITVEGTKEILGYSIAPNESAEIWKELLEDFKSRGLESISLFCTDGLAGMEEVIEQTFPTAKEVYNASKLEEALSSLETFTSKWKRKYPFPLLGSTRTMSMDILISVFLWFHQISILYWIFSIQPI